MYKKKKLPSLEATGYLDTDKFVQGFKINIDRLNKVGLNMINVIQNDIYADLSLQCLYFSSRNLSNPAYSCFLLSYFFT